MFQQCPAALADFSTVGLRIHAQYGGASAGGGKQPQQQADGGGLSRSVGSQEAKDDPGGNIQAHPVEGLHPAERTGKLFGVNGN